MREKSQMPAENAAKPRGTVTRPSGSCCTKDTPLGIGVVGVEPASGAERIPPSSAVKET